MAEQGPSHIQIASAKVAAIVEAAERAADELREQTELRARERIAEADRAADLRVAAAEREAAELRAEAEAAVQHIHQEAARVRAEADAARTATLAEAQRGAEQVRAEAEAYAEETRRRAQADAREILLEAHAAARDVLTDGSTISGHLEELSLSLRRNAERLLNDVKLAHHRLVGDLDAATPPGTEPVRASRGGAGPSPSPSPAGGRSAPPGVSDEEAALLEAARAGLAEDTGQSRSARARAARRRAEGAAKGFDTDFDVPEFVPGQR